MPACQWNPGATSLNPTSVKSPPGSHHFSKCFDNTPPNAVSVQLHFRSTTTFSVKYYITSSPIITFHLLISIVEICQHVCPYWSQGRATSRCRRRRTQASWDGNEACNKPSWRGREERGCSCKYPFFVRWDDGDSVLSWSLRTILTSLNRPWPNRQLRSHLLLLTPSLLLQLLSLIMYFPCSVEVQRRIRRKRTKIVEKPVEVPRTKRRLLLTKILRSVFCWHEQEKSSGY